MDAPFVHRPTVRFTDVDGLGHVNNAVFLTYLEEARVALFRELTEKRGLEIFDFLLARAEVDFRRPIHMEDPLEVALWTVEVGTSSFRFGYELTVDGETVGQAQTVQVWIDRDAKASAPVPDDVRAALEALTLEG